MKISRYDSNYAKYFEYRSILLQQAGDNSAHMACLRRALRTAMGEELTPRQRQLVQLYYMEGRSMGEISRQLGVGTPSVSRTLRRARARLRRCMRYTMAAEGLQSPEEQD